MNKKKLLKEILDDREDICNLYTRSNDARQEISNINRTLNDGPIANHSKRIADLEEACGGLWEKSTEQDANIASMLAALPEIEILKVQVAGLEKRYDMMESADCANLERLNKNNDVARECRYRLAIEILKMQERIKGLVNRLSPKPRKAGKKVR